MNDEMIKKSLENISMPEDMQKRVIEKCADGTQPAVRKKSFSLRPVAIAAAGAAAVAAVGIGVWQGVLPQLSEAVPSVQESGAVSEEMSGLFNVGSTVYYTDKDGQASILRVESEETKQELTSWGEGLVTVPVEPVVPSNGEMYIFNIAEGTPVLFNSENEWYFSTYDGTSGETHRVENFTYPPFNCFADYSSEKPLLTFLDFMAAEYDCHSENRAITWSDLEPYLCEFVIDGDSATRVYDIEGIFEIRLTGEPFGEELSLPKDIEKLKTAPDTAPASVTLISANDKNVNDTDLLGTNLWEAFADGFGGIFGRLGKDTFCLIPLLSEQPDEPLDVDRYRYDIVYMNYDELAKYYGADFSKLSSIPEGMSFYKLPETELFLLQNSDKEIYSDRLSFSYFDNSDPDDRYIIISPSLISFSGENHILEHGTDESTVINGKLLFTGISRSDDGCCYTAQLTVQDACLDISAKNVMLSELTDVIKELMSNDYKTPSEINDDIKVAELTPDRWSDRPESPELRDEDFVPMTEAELMDYFGINVFAEVPDDLTENLMSDHNRGLYVKDGEAYYSYCPYEYADPSGKRTIQVFFSYGKLQEGINGVWDDKDQLSSIQGVPAAVIHSYDGNDNYEIQFMLDNTWVRIDCYGGFALDEMIEVARSLIMNAHSDVDHIRYFDEHDPGYGDIDPREFADEKDFVPMTEEELREYYGVEIMPDFPWGLTGAFTAETGVYKYSDGTIYNSFNTIRAQGSGKDIKVMISKDSDNYGDDALMYLSGFASTICGNTAMLYRYADEDGSYMADFSNGGVDFEIIAKGITEEELENMVRSLLDPEKRKKDLTINDLLSIKERKGEDLTWSDFKNYNFTEIGSGLFIAQLDVEGRYTLDITAFSPSSDEALLQAALTQNGGDRSIDLLANSYSEVFDYINSRTPELLPEGSQPLTLTDIINLMAEKGNDLTWSDFEQYQSEDIGSGLYILRYDVEGDYELLIGGGDTSKKPDYIALIYKDDSGSDSAGVNLLTDDFAFVRDYINSNTPDRLPPKDFAVGGGDITQQVKDTIKTALANGFTTDEFIAALKAVSDEITKVSVTKDNVPADGSAKLENGMNVVVEYGGGSAMATTVNVDENDIASTG